MEEDLISISTLNDFFFCPYSIYLHSVYMDTDEDIYHAVPQTQGRLSHTSIDQKTAHHKDELCALPVFSEKYGLVGKIDMYRMNEHSLIERKYQLKNIFKGQVYQLWAQMLCLEEMGYIVHNLAFYEISTNKMIPISPPNDTELKEFESFLIQFRKYKPQSPLTINASKCRHCIYCNLCDKTSLENVYS